ncbi:hypothetical protein L198_03119 [Cryptococcus wingfieldii CBS 7118]|uniref:Uncharacterized protein n=1 Tax=Cryptococcus wingfieldii CBS 7118 TaxID=1295528 RepID=A0A1E3JLI9_9TREE|nr:hypothetical protein L198_03119 [Cryptococcus wingfieldii CBS 7118]ODO00792.1 hypothetical protein L198_03119 [Cryptococcus wingfieldii CBS 7118]
MQGIGDASPHTPESVASWIRSFPLDPLEYEIDTTGKSTRKSASKTYRIWGDLDEKGIRVVHDQTLNGRISASLRSQQSSLSKGVTPFMEEDLRVARRSARRTTVEAEIHLRGVMRSNFFDCSTDAINSRLPSHLHGKWKPFSGEESDRLYWVFMRNGIAIAIIEVKMCTDLTTSGEGAVSQTDDRDHPPTEKVELCSRPQGDTAERGGAQSDASHSDQSQADKKEHSDSHHVPDNENELDEEISVHRPLKLERLLMACRQDGGLKLILASGTGKDGKVRPALRIVDQDGTIVPEMTYWAKEISQVSSENYYDLL